MVNNRKGTKMGSASCEWVRQWLPLLVEDADETRGDVLNSWDTHESSHLPGRFDGAGVVEDPLQTLVGVDLK